MLKVILFLYEQRVFKHIFAFVSMHVCTFKRTHERSNRLCVALIAWFAWAALLAGITVSATSKGKACNECKTLGQLGVVCV